MPGCGWVDLDHRLIAHNAPMKAPRQNIVFQWREQSKGDFVQVSPKPQPFFLAATEAADGCMKSNRLLLLVESVLDLSYQSSPQITPPNKLYSQGKLHKEGGRERERERERAREREREREREKKTRRDRQRQTETDRDRQRQTETDSCQQVSFIQWQDLPKTWSCRKSRSCKGSKW